jgi:hypothetical protein
LVYQALLQCLKEHWKMKKNCCHYPSFQASLLWNITSQSFFLHAWSLLSVLPYLSLPTSMLPSMLMQQCSSPAEQISLPSLPFHVLHEDSPPLMVLCFYADLVVMVIHYFNTGCKCLPFKCSPSLQNLIWYQMICN